MEIKKQEIVKITDDFGTSVCVGDTVVLDTSYGLIIGKFNGLTKGGAMEFISPFRDIERKMCFRPASILKMKCLNIDFC